MTELKSKIVVITGASAGVGRAVAQRFAREKARIALVARGRAGLEAARREVEKLGGRAKIYPVDVSDISGLERVARDVETKWGPIDFWINNAMCSVFSPVKEMTADEYRRVTEVTYLGYVYGTLVALRRMLPRDRGVIVQVGSALVYRSIPLQSAYCAAKHAVLGFTESLRTELLHDKSNVKVTIVNLPAVNTPQFAWVKSRLPRKPQPVPPIYQPEIPAEAIYHAAYHPRREYFVGYPTLKAVLGEKIAPGYADRYLARTGYDSQQTNEPDDHLRPNNLWSPVEKDFGAHGSFDKRAKSFSLQVWLDLHPALTLIGVTLLGAAAAKLWKPRSRNKFIFRRSPVGSRSRESTSYTH